MKTKLTEMSKSEKRNFVNNELIMYLENHGIVCEFNDDGGDSHGIACGIGHANQLQWHFHAASCAKQSRLFGQRQKEEDEEEQDEEQHKNQEDHYHITYQ